MAVARARIPRPSTTSPRRLPPRVIAAADEASILGIRAGTATTHRFVGVWPIVVEGRLFARSWTVRPGGWFDTFCRDPLGVIQIGDRQVRIRAIRVRSERLKDAIEAGYAGKYATKASRKYVVGFRRQRRRDATIEFVPRHRG
jgi:hypothetical protein